MEKVIIAFNNKSIGEWMQSIHNQQVIRIISPISVHVSISVPEAFYDTFNVTNLLKEVTATLVYEKFIANSQQIKEIACEKKKSQHQEFCLFLQQE